MCYANVVVLGVIDRILLIHGMLRLNEFFGYACVSAINNQRLASTLIFFCCDLQPRDTFYFLLQIINTAIKLDPICSAVICS